MSTKKYIVTIEQPMTLSITVRAENEELAQDIALERFDKMTRKAFDKQADFGTDAQCMVEDESGEVVTEWN